MHTPFFFFFEMYRIEENLVYYQLFILLVVSCGMNGSHGAGAETYCKCRACAHTRRAQAVSDRVRTQSYWTRGGGDYTANTTHRSQVPKTECKFQDVLYIFIKYLYHTLKLTFELTSYGPYAVAMCNFRKVKL